MIRTMQDLLDSGVNAFAVRLLAKDFEKMNAGQPKVEPVHVPVPVNGGRTVWVSFSEDPPPEAKKPKPAVAHACEEECCLPK
jgi:hypothetical protein